MRKCLRKMYGSPIRLMCLIVTTIFLIYLYFVNYATFTSDMPKNIEQFPCIIPRFEPFHESAKQLHRIIPRLQCPELPSFIYINSSGYVHQNISEISALGYKNLRCRYNIIERKDLSSVIFKPTKTLVTPVYVSADIIYVKCYDDEDDMIYDRVLQNVDYKRVFRRKNIKQESKDQLSVIMFGLDSVSRLSAERNLPRTMRFLKEDLKAYVFRGHTKVAEGSFPNLISAFTGELPFPKEFPSFNGLKDNNQFVWTYFSKNGYVTYHSEDWPNDSPFNVFSGFKGQLSFDHYIRPYYYATRIVDKIVLDVHDLLFLEHKNIKLKTRSSTFCDRNLPKHRVTINNIKRFTQVYKNNLKFSLSWLSELGHEFSVFLQYADNDIREFFKWMKQNGVLDKSILVFFSDHGIRTTEIRNTFAGRIEDFMPLLAIVFPENLNEIYPNAITNLSRNTRRLTTPFDLHETLKDILLSNIEDNGIDVGKNTQNRGISLFKYIPDNRSCFEASIGPAYCPCYVSHKLSIDEPQVISIASFMVTKINYYLKDFQHKCAKVHLSKILSAEFLYSNNKNGTLSTYFSYSRYTRPGYFLVKFETLPEKDNLEALATVQSGEVQLIGNIIKLNKRFKPVFCLKLKFQLLRKYCSCL